jgi:hypothetical protein
MGPGKLGHNGMQNNAIRKLPPSANISMTKAD